MSLFNVLHKEEFQFFAGYFTKTAHARAYPYLRIDVPLASVFVYKHAKLAKQLQLHKKPYPINSALPQEVSLGRLPARHLMDRVTGDRTAAILRLVDRRKPLLLKGLLDFWPGFVTGEYTMEGLTEFLLGEYIGVNANVAGNELRIQLNNLKRVYFDDETKAATDDEPLLVYDKNYPAKLKTNPHEIWVFPEDLYSHLSESQKPTTQIMTIEPFRGGLPIKRSRFGQDYWSALTEGMKLWICFPPQTTRGELDVMNFHRGGNEWFHSVYLNKLLNKEERLEFIQKAGDVVYIPHHWWFKWISLADSNVSFSKFFVDRVNIRTAWYDMGGSLPKSQHDSHDYDPHSIQDNFAEDSETSSTRRLSPLGFRSLLWPSWRHFLNNPVVNQLVGVSNSRSVRDEDFWRDTSGMALSFMDKAFY